MNYQQANGSEQGSQTENLPVEFKFENHPVRTAVKDDEIWFVAADVCEVLDIKNTTDTIPFRPKDARPRA